MCTHVCEHTCTHTLSPHSLTTQMFVRGNKSLSQERLVLIPPAKHVFLPQYNDMLIFLLYCQSYIVIDMLMLYVLS